MPTQGSATTTIAAPPAQVWPWIVQVERHGEWSPKAHQVSRTSGDGDAVGSRYHSTGAVPGDKHHENDVEITELVPEQRLVLRASDPMGTFTNRYDLKPVEGGTEVTHHIEFPPLKGIAAMMVPILFPLVGKTDMRKRLGLLKAKVEAGG